MITRAFLQAVLVMTNVVTYSQSFLSNWSESGEPGKIDSVIIEIDHYKITFEIPRKIGPDLLFADTLDKKIDKTPQAFKATPVFPVEYALSPEFRKLLVKYPPVLQGDLSLDGDILRFTNDLIFFSIPEKEGSLINGEWPYLRKNTFDVDSTWTTTVRPWSMKELLRYPIPPHMAFTCGFIDGIIEDIQMVVSVAEFHNQNTLLIFGDMQAYDLMVDEMDSTFVKEYGFLLPLQFKDEARLARKQQRDLVMAIGKYIDLQAPYKTGTLPIKPELYELFESALSELYDEMVVWMAEYNFQEGLKPALYTRGKIAYMVASALIGVREVSLVLSGITRGTKTFQVVKNVLCFTGDTPVLTNHGLIQISRLNLGHNISESEQPNN